MNTSITLQPQAKILTKNRVMILILSMLLALLALELVMSLQWRPVHDTAHLNYIAWLIDRHGLVPYRDIFETSMPFSIMIHLLIGRVLGYGDSTFRMVDVVWLLSLLSLTAHLMLPLGKRTAVAGAVVFGLIYLSYGPSLSFQRDYLGLLPITAALLVARRPDRPVWRALLIGALFGVAISIKPHLGLGLPVVLAYALASSASDVRAWAAKPFANGVALILIAIAGLAIVAVLPLLWLWQSGGLAAWWVISSRYLPLYLQMNGMHKILTGLDRLLYLFESFQKLGGQAALLIPASLGIYVALFESRLALKEKRLVGIMVALMMVYGLYPVLGGQFWAYHWMPFIYFAALCGALILAEPVDNYHAARRWVGPLVFVLGLLLVIRPAPDFFRQLDRQAPRPPKNGRVDEMAAFLRHELQPGDTVQPLDWVDGGTAQAMHLAGALPATRFLYDAEFYHHVSKDYIQELRTELMYHLETAPPRFILDIPDQLRPTGLDTSGDFPALTSFIENYYAPAQRGDGYVIYEYAR